MNSSSAKGGDDMFLLVAFIAAMPFLDWDELSAEDQQKVALHIGRKYLRSEPSCINVKITAVKEDDTVLFDAECIEVRKTNI